MRDKGPHRALCVWPTHWFHELRAQGFGTWIYMRSYPALLFCTLSAQNPTVVRRASPGSIRNPEAYPGSAQHPESSLEAKTDPREHTAKAGKPEETRHHPKGHREAQSSPEAPQGARIQLHGTPGDGVRIRFSSGHAGARRWHRSTDRAGLRRASLSYGVAPKSSGRAGVLFYAGDRSAAHACV